MLSPQFTTFLLVAETGSFARAAERLFITPASVMHQINQLESRLGIKLLARSNRGTTLTEAGKSLYVSGIQLRGACADALIKAQGRASESGAYIRVGSSFLNPAGVLLEKWELFKRKYPEFHFTIIPYNDDHRQIEAVLDRVGGDIDLLVGRFNSRMLRQGTIFHTMGQYRICAAVPHTHPLARKKRLSLEDMHGEKIILGRSGASLHIIRLRDMFAREHPQVHIVDTDYLFDVDTFNECERQGALLITLDAWASIHPSLVTLPVDWDFTVDYGILSERHPNAQTAEFLRILDREGITLK